MCSLICALLLAKAINTQTYCVCDSNAESSEFIHSLLGVNIIDVTCDDVDVMKTNVSQPSFFKTSSHHKKPQLFANYEGSRRCRFSKLLGHIESLYFHIIIWIIITYVNWIDI